jgi:hypothetical protein
MENPIAGSNRELDGTSLCRRYLPCNTEGNSEIGLVVCFDGPADRRSRWGKDRVTEMPPEAWLDAELRRIVAEQWVWWKLLAEMGSRDAVDTVPNEPKRSETS